MSSFEPVEATTAYTSADTQVKFDVLLEEWEVGNRRWRQHRVLMQEGRTGVVVVAVDPRGFLLLVRQWRAATRQWSWEFPRGFGESDDIGRDALRELSEETGYTSREAEPIGRFYADSGVITNDSAVCVAAVDSTPPGSRDDEINELRWVASADLAGEIASGAINDGITIAAFALWQLRQT
jgi:8-oxo-dGTP pyrophosphatase MutT (NUDIX family)